MYHAVKKPSKIAVKLEKWSTGQRCKKCDYQLFFK